MTIRCNRPFAGLHRLVGAALCASLAALSPQVHGAPQSPFVAAAIGVFDGPGNEVTPELVRSEVVGPLVVETGALPDAYGTSRGAYGSNGFAMQVTGGIDREVDGGSVWSDGFVVNGGTGTGSLSLSSRLVGAVNGHAEMFHGVFVSDRPFDFQALADAVDVTDGFWNLQLPQATRLFYTGIANGCGQPRPMGDCGHVPFENYQGALDLALTQSIPFTYGQTFYVMSVLGGGVGTSGGSADFFNSATFGISVPAGATLASLSGSPYAAAIPEPASWMLLLAGLGFGAFAARRRVASGPVLQRRQLRTH